MATNQPLLPIRIYNRMGTDRLHNTMDKALLALKTALVSSPAKRFYWNTLSGAIGVVIVLLTDTPWVYAPILIALLNGISKEINNKFIK